MKNIEKVINIAMGRNKADLVLKGANIINVLTGSIEKGDIAICDDIIAGVGEYSGENEINCEGLYASPGLIDAHMHIESSMITPENLSGILKKRGVTTIIADPHEIANVMGKAGIRFMIENAKRSVIDIFYMLPSCVPAVSFEDSGAVLRAEELSEFINNDGVLGLGEVMDVNAVTSGDKSMLNKLHMAQNAGKNMDGHCPQIGNRELNAYLAAGINTDHECADAETAEYKASRGMYVMLREGSAARNLVDLLPAVKDGNYQRFLFCTDDRHLEDLVTEGSIDNCLRLAVKHGLDPVRACTMASYNAAGCYGLKDRGYIAPGMKADIVLFEDIKDFAVKMVIMDGKSEEENKPSEKTDVVPCIKCERVDEEKFKVRAEGSKVNVIKVLKGSLETRKVVGNVISEGGFVKQVEADKDKALKISVIERHKGTGKYSVGYICGLGLKNAAIAQTIAHDSHNIMVVGDNDNDMAIAVNSLIDMNGGIAIVSEGHLLSSLSLPIAGLMIDERPEEVMKAVKELNSIARSYGICEGVDPFLTLGFMALPVIPDIKITARGLFHYNSFSFIPLFQN